MREAPTTFSITALAWVRSAARFEVRNPVSSFSTILVASRVTGGVPRTSLVWPSNWGSASRTVTTAVRPSSTSSLVTSSLARSRRVPSSDRAKARTRPRSKPVTWVPPLEVAMMLTNEATFVS